MYTTDDYANVSTSAQKGVDYLLDLQSTYPTGSHSNRLSVSSKRHLALSIQMTKFWNSLENNLSNLIKKLPRIFRTAPDAKKLGALYSSRLCSYSDRVYKVTERIPVYSREGKSNCASTSTILVLV